ncbi:XTP/dITP diphosphohydrolase [Saccharopolyspora antimicrobica]|uniref:XTP/dITP diphosphohydrolase n=1 Tax=Saccharopolyspora antimicrobica TaxID=455193 RepID=A0A1I5ETQ6_9PSEU|nr:MazG family protein [Saccharopolyspora antimicrobica]RKT83521.1 XTP/dITP diphosphohydrolase [Saccharopolyspora antimicrobica]SFO14421.1 XTP/dITP diphosphohydrolase [Saccharopolyspora antimicrobica]
MSEARVAEGSAVVLVDDRLGEVVPAAAVPLLRGAAVFAEPGLAPAAREALGAPEPPADLLARAAGEPVVLFVGDLGCADAEALRAAGAQVIGAPAPAGLELLDAVTVMDRLRSPGGCPWDAEQNHDTLRQYLVEETYELLDAIADRDREALREELGDVLLQVLFHARVAAEDAADPFDIDAVAAGLVSKLVSRHPHVFADGSAELDAESQHARWEELKQQEKQRESIVDGVALGQPAVALAAKLVQRANRAGIPAEALPSGESPGEALFAIAARTKLAGGDPEDELRAVALAFAERIRTAERRARESGREPAELAADEWRELMSDLSDPVAVRSKP